MPSDAERPGYHEYLFVGTNGHVHALDKASGRTVWSTSLPRTGYSVVSIVFEDGFLFCASGGRVFAVNPKNGKIVWTNGLPGQGSGLVYLATVETNDSERVMSLFAQALADQQKSSNQAGHAGSGSV